MLPHDRTLDPRGYRTTATVGESLTTTAVLVGLAALGLLAATAPVPVFGTLAIVLAPLAARRAAHRLDARRRADRTRRVCLPVVHVCITA